MRRAEDVNFVSGRQQLGITFKEAAEAEAVAAQEARGKAKNLPQHLQRKRIWYAVGGMPTATATTTRIKTTYASSDVATWADAATREKEKTGNKNEKSREQRLKNLQFGLSFSFSYEIGSLHFALPRKDFCQYQSAF